MSELEKGLVLCIDPGLRGCGVAVFAPYGKLLRAGYPRSKLTADSGVRGPAAWRAMGDAVKAWYLSPGERGFETTMTPPLRVIIEEQVVDGRTRNANDMLEVSGVAGACSMLFATTNIISVRPEGWKGSIPKDEMTERIRARMNESPEERARLEKVPASLEHNMLDGVGLGLWHFGRLAARKAIAR